MKRSKMTAARQALVWGVLSMPIHAASAIAQSPSGAVSLQGMQGLAYLHPQRATLVGYGGRIVQTSDGGVTWVEQHGDSTIDLTGVAFPSRDIGIAVGYRRTASYSTPGEARILRTTDGGASWALVPAPVGAMMLRAVAFADARQGVAVGTTGVVVRTTDAGATWQLVHPGNDESLEAITLVGSSGWALGRQFLLRTTDGGAHWRREKRDGLLYRGAAFADAQHGVLVGTDFVHVTADGGRTWRADVAGLIEYSSEAVRRGIVTRERQDGVTGFTSVAMPAPSTIVATSNTGAIARSDDGGSTWHVGDSGSRFGFFGIAFADALNGLAIGLDKVVRTSDGGATWSDVTNTSGRLAVGALTGEWTIEVSFLTTPGMSCDYNKQMTMSLVHGDSALNGTMNGWRLSCRGTSETATATARTTRESSLDATFPLLPVSGWTDRLHGVRLGFEVRGGRAQFEGDLSEAGMSGPVRFNLYTERLGEVEIEAHWNARRNETRARAVTPAETVTPAEAVIPDSVPAAAGHVDLVVPIAVLRSTTSGIAETRFQGVKQQQGAFGRVAPAPGGGVEFALSDWDHWKDTVFLPTVQAPVAHAARVTMVWEDSSDASGLFGIAIGDESATRTWAELVSGGVHYLYVNGQFSNNFHRNRSGVDTLVLDVRESAITAFVDGKLLLQCVASSPVGGMVKVFGESSASAIIRLVRVEALKGPAARTPTINPGDCQRI